MKQTVKGGKTRKDTTSASPDNPQEGDIGKKQGFAKARKDLKLIVKNRKEKVLPKNSSDDDQVQQKQKQKQKKKKKKTKLHKNSRQKSPEPDVSIAKDGQMRKANLARLKRDKKRTQVSSDGDKRSPGISGRKRATPEERRCEDGQHKKAKHSNQTPGNPAARQKLSAAEKRVADFRARTINDEIAQHANRRELSEAKRCYEQAIKEKVANGHTFTITVNAFVRCGDNEGAAKTIADMEAYGLSPCVITFTTLINGHCKAGDLRGALATLRDMTTRKPPVLPNLRTVNTLLRGCMLVGAVTVAEGVFQRMVSEWRLTPDASSYEYLLTLLCQALQLHRASVVIDQLKERLAARAKQHAAQDDPAAAAARSGQVYVCMARAAAVLNDKAMYRASSRQARDALKDGGAPAEGVQGEQAAGGQERGSEGGKRGWRVTGEEREAAASVFDAHRRGELARELDMIDGYARRLFGEEGRKKAKKRRKEAGKDGGGEQGQREGEGGARGEDVSSCLLRVVALDLEEGWGEWAALAGGAKAADTAGGAGRGGLTGGAQKGKKGKGEPAGASRDEEGPVLEAGEESAKEAAVRKMVAALREKFGLDEVLAQEQEEREQPAQGGGEGAAGEKGKKKKKQSVGAEEREQRAAAFRERVRAQVDSRGRLRFAKMFGNELPVRLEICSGAGEWAAAQAEAEAGTANWATLELRHDRVYQGFSRMLCLGCSNLAVIGGDATAILPHHIPPRAVSAILVNHPEPPQQTGSADASSEGFHLLNADFLLSMHRALVEGGMLTIVTDNRWYGMLLVKIVAEFNSAHRREGFGFTSKPLAGGAEVHSKAGISLVQRSPGPDCGHAAQASSYFDRLWRKGINRHADTTNRYVLCVLRRAP